MRIHIIFLFLYIALGSVLSGQYLNALLIVQCAISLITDKNTLRKNQFATPINVYYASNIFISVSNIMLIENVDYLGSTSYSYIIKEYIDMASLIWVIGNTMAFIGYNFFSKVSFPTIKYTINDKTAIGMFKYIVLAFLLFPLFKSQLAFLGSFTKIIMLPTTIGILFYARIAARYNNKKYFQYALILFALQTTFAALNSYLRFELILPAIVLFMGYFLGQRNIRSFFSPKVIPFLLVFFLFSQLFRSLGSNRSNFIVAIENLYVFDNNDDNKDNVHDDDLITDKTKGGLLDRTSCLAQITRIVWLTQKNGFYNGTASAPLLAALIPRVLWPDKPQIQLGQWFALEAGLAYKSDAGKTNNSVNLTIPGECYLDFGWIGVVIGCFLFGLFIAALWHSVGFYTSEYNIIGILMGGFILIFSMYGIAGDLQIVITDISTYLCFLMIKNILPKESAQA